MECSRHSAVGKMEDGYSEGRGFEPVSGTLAFVGMKISNLQHAACCSGALLATLSRCMFLCEQDGKCLFHLNA